MGFKQLLCVRIASKTIKGCLSMFCFFRYVPLLGSRKTIMALVLQCKVYLLNQVHVQLTVSTKFPLPDLNERDLVNHFVNEWTRICQQPQVNNLVKEEHNKDLTLVLTCIFEHVSYTKKTTDMSSTSKPFRYTVLFFILFFSNTELNYLTILLNGEQLRFQRRR